jgi:hypothetical protein
MYSITFYSIELEDLLLFSVALCYNYRAFFSKASTRVLVYQELFIYLGLGRILGLFLCLCGTLKKNSKSAIKS